MRTDEERFMAKVTVSGGHWLWHGAVTIPKRNGARYGQFWHDGVKKPAHRWAYEHFIRPVPPGCVVERTCDSAMCVNPEHLRAVTREESALDTPIGRTRDNDTCVNGHRLDETNTYWRKDRPGRRQCRKCGTEASRRLRRKEEKNA